MVATAARAGDASIKSPELGSGDSTEMAFISLHCSAVVGCPCQSSSIEDMTKKSVQTLSRAILASVHSCFVHDFALWNPRT